MSKIGNPYSLKEIIQELEKLDKSDEWSLITFQFERDPIVNHEATEKTGAFHLCYKPGPKLDIHISLRKI